MQKEVEEMFSQEMARETWKKEKGERRNCRQKMKRISQKEKKCVRQNESFFFFSDGIQINFCHGPLDREGERDE